MRRAVKQWQPNAGLVYFHLLLARLSRAGVLNRAGIDVEWVILITAPPAIALTAHVQPDTSLGFPSPAPTASAREAAHGRRW